MGWRRRQTRGRGGRREAKLEEEGEAKLEEGARGELDSKGEGRRKRAMAQEREQQRVLYRTQNSCR